MEVILSKQRFGGCTSSVMLALQCMHANCIPRTKYVRGSIYGFKSQSLRTAAAASADYFIVLTITIKNPYRIASIFYM